MPDNYWLCIYGIGRPEGRPLTKSLDTKTLGLPIPFGESSESLIKPGCPSELVFAAIFSPSESENTITRKGKVPSRAISSQRKFQSPYWAWSISRWITYSFQKYPGSSPWGLPVCTDRRQGLQVCEDMVYTSDFCNATFQIDFRDCMLAKHNIHYPINLGRPKRHRRGGQPEREQKIGPGHDIADRNSSRINFLDSQRNFSVLKISRIPGICLLKAEIFLYASYSIMGTESPGTIITLIEPEPPMQKRTGNQ